MYKILLILIMAFSILFQPTPAPVVNAVLFYTPGCSYCQAVIGSVLPPLQARYGERLSIVAVPLNGIEDVDTLFAAADFFGLKKEDVAVPFLVVGSQVLVGQQAIQAQFPGLIEQGLAQGGIPAPRLPAALATLAARPSPTPLPPGVELGPVVPRAQAASSHPPGNCSERPPCPVSWPCRPIRGRTGKSFTSTW